MRNLGRHPVIAGATAVGLIGASVALVLEYRAAHGPSAPAVAASSALSASRATTQQGTPGSPKRAAVTACTFSPVPGEAAQAHAPKGPVTIPAYVATPAGAAVYGTGAPVTPTTVEELDVLGPAGEACQGNEGVDGGLVLSLFPRPPSNPGSGPTNGQAAASVLTIFSGGGAVQPTVLACPYIAAAAQAPVSQGADCTPPQGAVVQDIPTGRPGSYAAVVAEPPQLGMVPYPSMLVVTFQSTPDGNGSGQESACSLPPDQRPLCAASLAFFLDDQSEVGRSMTPTQLAVAAQAISVFVKEH